MTAQPPFDPGAYRSDAVPSDTQAIYIQEGGAEPRGILFHSPTKHPKILRLQEIMIVSALLCLIHGVISSFAPDNLSPLKGLPEVGVAGGIGLLVVSAVVYICLLHDSEGQASGPDCWSDFCDSGCVRGDFVSDW